MRLIIGKLATKAQVLNILLIVAIFFLWTGFALAFTDVNTTSQIKAPSFVTVKYIGGSKEKLYIKGTTDQNKNVLIYIDGSYTDIANISKKDSKKFIFTYVYNKPLTKGKHQIKVIAQDKSSQKLSSPGCYTFNIFGLKKKSQPSNPLKNPRPSLPAPIIFSPILNKKHPKTPIITGVTPNNSKVYIYINGTKMGETPVLEHPSGSPAFYFEAPHLLKLGEHRIKALAVTPQGKTSAYSSPVILTLSSQPQPAPPILITPKEGQKITKPKVQISGVTRDSTDVNIYLNNQLFKRVSAPSHPSGVSGFLLSLDCENLSRGEHEIYTTAINKKGKESQKSSRVSFIVRRSQIGKEAISIKATSTTNKNNTTSKKIANTVKNNSQGKKVVKSKEVNKNGILSDREKLQKEEWLSFAIFGSVIIVILLWIWWANKGSI